MTPATPSLQGANGSRERAPDDGLRDEAIHSVPRGDVDCFASLAMTRTERAMSKSAFDKIKAALEAAKAYLDGSRDKRDFKVHIPERKAKSA
jgi:hypothetical protein